MQHHATPGKHALVGVIASVAAFISTSTLLPAAQATDKAVELLNVSYDPTRELWRALNAQFISQYTKQIGTTLAIKQ